ncbi:LRR receptor-like serine/threonine-protein kinase EFR [Hibiscus syriacus]|uniref:LRR receptor-like serine/threonine-protein kinase EFR n=1 Tax=Hibiscus syriacus TaxID=106335 RepID=UPI001923C540|nr:LRR receptor-like serine/threonine-protein kinase EFR [Hibiscus syriacus]
MESWNSSIHFCQWHGVTCGRKHQRVTTLELQFLKLSGSLSLNLGGNNFYNQIPQEIDHLRRLEILDLTNKKSISTIKKLVEIHGSIKKHMGLNLLGLATASPAVRGNETDQQDLLQFKSKIIGDQLRSLESWNSSIHFCQWRGVALHGVAGIREELNLAANGFNNQIPQEVGRLKRLERLDLTNISISGEIPSNLSACSQLTFVSMLGNKITGEIPSLLGLLSNLKILTFSNNSLTGNIPPSLGKLSSLEVLDLSLNGLTGTIPEALGQLANLSYFFVGVNAISGIVPIATFNLSNIREFDIGGNKIEGTLPCDLAIIMPYLKFFSVGRNQISGQIPISIFNASNLNALEFGGNRLSGNVPSLENLNGLRGLLLGTNYLGHGREDDLHFLCTLVNNTKLEQLYISQNNLGDVFPECISNFSSTLLGLVMEENKIWGRIPNGIGDLINLEVLVASE